MKKRFIIITALLCLVLAFSIVPAYAAGGVEISAANFPDANFRSYVSSEFDTDGDGFLSADEISEATFVNTDGKGISSLKGIEYLTSLDNLWLYGKSITSVDLRKNTMLRRLDCVGTGITSLDIRRNTKLTNLTVYGNSFTTLDVSRCRVIVDALKGQPQSTQSYTVNGAQYTVDVYQHYYSETGIGTGTAMVRVQRGLDIRTEPDPNPGTGDIPLDEEHFPDEDFRTRIKSMFDKDNNNYLSDVELEVTEMDFTGVMKSMKGIEYFTELETLSIGLSKVEELDLSANTKLKSVKINNAKLTDIFFGINPNLTTINLKGNMTLKSLDVSDLENLGYLILTSTGITELDVRNNPLLRNLTCDHSYITCIDVRRNPLITTLQCNNCPNLESIKLGDADNLAMLYCHYAALTELDISRCDWVKETYELGNSTNFGTYKVYKTSSGYERLKVDSSVTVISEYSCPEMTSYTAEPIFVDAAGSTIEVDSPVPCALLYTDENGEYVSIPAEEGYYGMYGFTVPEDAGPVILVVKGDTDLNGKLTNADSTKIKSYLKEMTTLSKLQLFCADVDGSGAVKNSDATKIKAFLRGTGNIAW